MRECLQNDEGADAAAAAVGHRAGQVRPSEHVRDLVEDQSERMCESGARGCERFASGDLDDVVEEGTEEPAHRGGPGGRADQVQRVLAGEELVGIEARIARIAERVRREFAGPLDGATAFWTPNHVDDTSRSSPETSASKLSPHPGAPSDRRTSTADRARDGLVPQS